MIPNSQCRARLQVAGSTGVWEGQRPGGQAGEEVWLQPSQPSGAPSSELRGFFRIGGSVPGPQAALKPVTQRQTAGRDGWRRQLNKAGKAPPTAQHRAKTPRGGKAMGTGVFEALRHRRRPGQLGHILAPQPPRAWASCNFSIRTASQPQLDPLAQFPACHLAVRFMNQCLRLRPSVSGGPVPR